MNSAQDIGNLAKKKIFTFPGGRMALSALLIVEKNVLQQWLHSWCGR
jgi:hypothetical protein